MKYLPHRSAKPSHYNKEAKSYDSFNEKKSEQINQLIENTLHHYEVKTVLDLTCGTGSQVFWLTKYGYEVIGSDISSKMLQIARSKAKQKKINLKFINGDMRIIKVGAFDAVVTIFNSIGHLTKLDFEVTIRNIHENLKDGGLYIFDIFNLGYLLDSDNITRLTIDWQEVVGNTKFREIQYSTINEEGILASYDTYYEKRDSNPPKITCSAQTLQVYTAEQLMEMLHRNGFQVLSQCGIDGSQIVENKTERIVTVAQKI